jgi:hypothetical protein
MQSHGCLQLAEEADKEQKKMADKIAEHAELVKVPPDLVPLRLPSLFHHRRN